MRQSNTSNWAQSPQKHKAYAAEVTPSRNPALPPCMQFHHASLSHISILAQFLFTSLAAGGPQSRFLGIHLRPWQIRGRGHPRARRFVLVAADRSAPGEKPCKLHHFHLFPPYSFLRRRGHRSGFLPWERRPTFLWRSGRLGLVGWW